jgi:hypothetical protein
MPGLRGTTRKAHAGIELVGPLRCDNRLKCDHHPHDRFPNPGNYRFASDPGGTDSQNRRSVHPGALQPIPPLYRERTAIASLSFKRTAQAG